MKKYLSILFKLCAIILFSTFSGCIKDTCKNTNTYVFYKPVYETKTEAIANIKSNPARDIKEPGKIVILGNYIYLNEVNKGFHIIDNSNPSSPRNIAFIDIPGNVDLAITGNTLYADFYADLVTLNISNPLNVITTKIVNNVFPQRNYGYGWNADSNKVIYNWILHDTTIIQDCSQTAWMWDSAYLVYSSFGGINRNAATVVGINGSMSRFALTGDYLYTVDDADLNVFNISNVNNPTFLNKIHVDWHVETIYPFKNQLFVGSNSGTFIYDISTSPNHPAKVGEFTHARMCDPVIADDTFAYITLHSGTTCLGFNNELDIVRLNNLSNVQLVKIYSMTSPHGLSKDGNLLFICDGIDGLKIYDASNVLKLRLLKQITGLETYDVIAHNNIVLVIAKDGIYQYDYSSVNNIHPISVINISN